VTESLYVVENSKLAKRPLLALWQQKRGAGTIQRLLYHQMTKNILLEQYSKQDHQQI